MKTVATTEIGELFPPLKRFVVNAVVKYVKRMVPRWRIRGAVAPVASRIGWTSRIKLVVVRRDPKLTKPQLLEHLAQNLTPYKVPKIVEFRAKLLPKTNIGKILRRELREPMSV